MMNRENNIYSDEYLRDIWNSSPDAIDAGLSAQMKRAIDKEIFNSDNSPIQNYSPKHRRKTWTSVQIAFCSVLLLLTVLTGIIFHPKHIETTQLSKTQIVTDKGQKASLTLEDGTKLWLNCDSELSFASFATAGSRDVYLKGECYFEVAKDPGKPFVVHTDVYDVTAVGTSFNVRAYPLDNSVKTTLVEGKVLVCGGGFQTSLLPNESVTYSRADGQFSKSQDERSFDDGVWKGGELYVEKGTTLYELSKILERQYDFEFKFQDDAVKEYTFEGVIKNSQFKTVLDLICLSAPVKYQIEGNRVVFSHK